MRVPLKAILCCSFALVFLFGHSVYAQSMSTGQVKAKVKALGTDSNVEITLKSGAVLRGRIHEAGPRDFIFVTSERAQAYAYKDVTKIRKTGTAIEGTRLTEQSRERQ